MSSKNIFLSHNSKDKGIVEPFANRLSDVFGREHVFYDSWSIQPGEGIIDRMESGLSDMDYFFLFVSENSMASNMVKLEWENALLQATRGKIKFIPVRLQDITLPTILQQTIYLDVYNNGFETVLRQMIDVVQGQNIYHGNARTYENVFARVHVVSDKELNIEFRAKLYMEPISKYLVLLKNEKEDISFQSPTDAMLMSGFNKDVPLESDKGRVLVNALSVDARRATTPGFPFRLVVTSKTKLEFLGLMKARNENYYDPIPLEVI